jgi:hypothetical protein
VSTKRTTPIAAKLAMALATTLGLAVLSGCGGQESPEAESPPLGTPADENPVGDAGPPVSNLAPPPPPPAAPMLSEEAASPEDPGAEADQDDDAAAPDDSAEKPELEQQRPGTDRVEAKTGVGKKGRGYGGGMVTEPIRAYFRTRQRLELEVKLPQAMNLYKAEHGHAPESHDAFMNKIIKPNHIQLPELPAGHRYVYDPEREELMVERPKK